MTYRDELLGVIHALNAKPKPCFNSGDQRLLESFAHLASILENERGELFGYQRLITHLEEAAAPRARDPVTAIAKWRGGGASSDDLTMLEFWRES